jgi:hypothetical protein
MKGSVAVSTSSGHATGEVSDLGSCIPSTDPALFSVRDAVHQTAGTLTYVWVIQSCVRLGSRIWCDRSGRVLALAAWAKVICRWTSRISIMGQRDPGSLVG